MSGHMLDAREADGRTHGGSSDSHHNMGGFSRGGGHTEKPATRQVLFADIAALFGNVGLGAVGAAQRP